MKTRKPLKRKTPLRSRRKEGPDTEREVHARAEAPTVRSLHRGVYGGTTSGQALAKEQASQHTGYMAAVRDLGYCMLCRRSCRPQFCHRDMTKGMGIKTDVREGWPGCPECHYLVGTSGQYTKEERRALELDLGKRTRCAVKAAGAWPAHLPQWSEI